MKRLLLIFILIMVNLVMMSCTDYSGYDEVKIPDDNIGTVMLPETWQFETIDDWLYITEKSSGDMIAFEYQKGNIIWQEDGTYTDNRIFNQLYEEYDQYRSEDLLTGNSNSSNVLVYEYEFQGNNEFLVTIYFASKNDNSYIIEFLFINSDVDRDTIITISKSYNQDNINE